MLAKQALYIVEVDLGFIWTCLVLLYHQRPNVLFAPDFVDWKFVPIESFHLLLWFRGLQLGQDCRRGRGRRRPS